MIKLGSGRGEQARGEATEKAGSGRNEGKESCENECEGGKVTNP